IAGTITDDLNFDVTRIVEKFFHVHDRAAEVTAGFGLGNFYRTEQRGFVVHDTHAAPAAACRGLDHDRETDLARGGECLCVVVGHRAVGAGHGRHAGSAHYV